ncbi:MAG: hypothetical protein ABII23_03335 [bacterium]
MKKKHKVLDGDIFLAAHDGCRMVATDNKHWRFRLMAYRENPDTYPYPLPIGHLSFLTVKSTGENIA